MKKLTMGLCVAALFVGSVAEAGVRKIVTDLGVADVIADNAIDTTAVFPVSNRLVWVADGDADGDGDPALCLVFTFTAASTDSFQVFVDYIMNKTVGATSTNYISTQTSYIARTSGALSTLLLTPGFPPDGIRVRMDNDDVTGTAATTDAEAWLIQMVQD